MEIISNSPNRPANLIIDVPEKDAKELIKTGEFVESIKENLIVDKKEDKKKQKENNII